MSRLPLEQMIASLRPSLPGLSNDGTIIGAATGAASGIVSVAVMSDTSLRLAQPGDVGHLLGRLAGEEQEQVLDRRAGPRGDAAQRGGLAECDVVIAPEADAGPVRMGELEADQPRE